MPLVTRAVRPRGAAAAVLIFGGAGEVAADANGLTADNVLPSGGGGLRFRLTRKTPLNLRADVAWGKQSRSFYISVGEAF